MSLLKERVLVFSVFKFWCSIIFLFIIRVSSLIHQVQSQYINVDWKAWSCDQHTVETEIIFCSNM